MSAFICRNDLFRTLAVYAVGRGQYSAHRVMPERLNLLPGSSPAALATQYATLLAAQNQRSVEYRYKDRPDDLVVIHVRPEHLLAASLKASPVQILKHCDCLEYQSCETPNWLETPAAKLIESIRRTAIRELPGYADASWDFRDARPATAAV